jgi:hypothetical protein
MARLKDDLCYCKPGAAGHIHGAKIDMMVWAEGILAIAELTTPNSLNRPSAKAIRQAQRLLKQKEM